MIRITVGLIVCVIYVILVVWMETKERRRVKSRRELDAEEWATKKWAELGRN